VFADITVRGKPRTNLPVYPETKAARETFGLGIREIA